MQVTIGQGTLDKLRRAQALLSHRAASRDVAEVLDFALDTLIQKLEKSKFASTEKPRSCKPSSEPSHYVPADVRREVWKRDGGRCTFASESGHRCGESKFLQYDHIEPVSRGGRSTASNLRLRCRAHNQFEAERLFGVPYMRHKRHFRAIAGSTAAAP